MWYKGQKLESFSLDVKKYLVQHLESWNLIPWGFQGMARMCLLAVAGSGPG